MAYSANKTKIFCKKGSATDFTEIPLLMEVPEFGCTAEKIDVTTLSDSTKQYLRGTKDYGDLVFKFMYENTTATSNYRVLKDMDDTGTKAAFKLQYPDGTIHMFDAIPTVKIDAGTLNGALTFTATMLLQSAITPTNPA